MRKLHHHQLVGGFWIVLRVGERHSRGDDDEDDTYFPTVQEPLAGRGVSGGHAPKAVDKPALDNDDRSINPDEFISGPNLENSQGIGANSLL